MSEPRTAAGRALLDHYHRAEPTSDYAIAGLEYDRKAILAIEAEARELDVERLENHRHSGYCPGCKVAIDLHPLDEEGIDVGRCPTPREALDALYALAAEQGS